jgi:multiple RNA-binding domain-containing protein 1
MGFGFAEYETAEKAVESVKKLNNHLLDGHKLILSLSRKKVQNMEEIQKLKQKIKAEDQTSTKLMIRNIAFQATKNDIKQLFQEYGSLKKVRLPKKMDGTHRGFAFVEYDTAEEAGLAKEVLGSTHLYGRKLVIEYEKGTA